MYPLCNLCASTLLLAMREESYVIRIYRKEKLPAPMQRVGGSRRQHDHVTLTGVIEMVERGERRAFHDIEELWGILSGTAGKSG